MEDLTSVNKYWYFLEHSALLKILPEIMISLSYDYMTLSHWSVARKLNSYCRTDISDMCKTTILLTELWMQIILLKLAMKVKNVIEFLYSNLNISEKEQICNG